MKIIHLISGGDTGGAKTHVLSLLQQLNQHITVQLVCFMDGPFADEARAMGIPTEIFGGNNIPRLRKRLTEYIRKGGYQLIHCHGSRANMIGALLRSTTGLPVATTVHSDYQLDYMGRPFSHLTFGTINAWALRQLDYRIGVSDATVDFLIDRGFPPDRSYAIYNGIDFTPAPPQGDRLEYLRNLGANVTEDSVVVGIAARLNPVKDISTLIRGFAAAHRECPRLRLVIAGDGEEREKLGALAKELGVEQEVTFAGWISGGMDRFYSALDINALTSLSETFPYALTEGARFHLATVASSVGGIPYLIDQNANGFLFAPGDYEALGRHLAQLGNDDELRRDMGERLYEKASTHFSLRNTLETQLHIYEEILRRHSRPAKKRDGVMICGAYGRGNAGDDAILEAILNEMRSIDPDMPVTVFSKDPKSTRRIYRVRAVGRINVLRWYPLMRRTALYINGGGSLIQDITSSRSLWFYLFNIFMSKRAGCKVLMYGCGIGPVTRDRHRRLTARILNANADVITLREPKSLDELNSMGVTAPEIILSADPALTLAPAPDSRTDSLLLGANIPLHGKYIGFSLRKWPGFDKKAAILRAGAEYAYNTYGLTPLFIAAEKFEDPQAGRMAAQGLSVPHYFLDDIGSSGTVIGVLSRLKALVGMRLHPLIFAAGQGIPLAGIVYDPKISSFLSYAGQDQFVALEDLTEENLRSMIDAVAAPSRSPEQDAENILKLRRLAQVNVDAARRLLNS